MLGSLWRLCSCSVSRASVMRVDFAGNERIFFTLALLPLSSTIWLEGGEWISYGKKDMQKLKERKRKNEMEEKE